MSKLRKQLTFDLFADKQSPIYKYFNKLSTAYYHIERSLNENGFSCHRQGSVYVSEKALSYDEVGYALSKVCEELPWLYECTRKFDVTNIGKTYDLLNDIADFCELYDDKRKEMEINKPQNDVSKQIECENTEDNGDKSVSIVNVENRDNLDGLELM